MSRICTMPFRGACLEARGIPERGTLTYDRDLPPRVFDLVVCGEVSGSLVLYFKELLRTGDFPVVTTRYKPPHPNFAMHPASIVGTVTEVRGPDGAVVYRRPCRTHGDDLRVMDDECLTDFVAKALYGMLGGQPCLVGEGFEDCKSRWLKWLREESDKEDLRNGEVSAV